MAHDFAVYAEYSNSTVVMQPEANIRMFNTVEVQSGDAIQLDQISGVITLGKGTYHILATSIVAPFYPSTDDDGRISDSDRPLGGYCRLRYKDKPGRFDTPIAIGSISSANMLPSMIDTFLVVDDRAEIVLDHQNSAKVAEDSLHLQVFIENSTWHIFARISIQKL